MKSLNLKTKLFASFAILVLFLGVAVFAGYKSLHELKGLLEEMYGEHYQSSVGVATLHAKLNGVRAALVTMMSETERARQDEQHKIIKELTGEIDSIFAGLLKNSSLKQDMISQIKEANAVWVAFRNTRDDEIIPAIYAGKLDEAKRLALTVQKERYNKFVALTDELIDKETKEAQGLTETSQVRYQSLIITFLVIGFLAVLTSVSIAVVLDRGIVSQVKAMAETPQKMASGDLDVAVEVKSKDEVGVLANAFKEMIAGLRNIVSQVKGGSAQVASASSQIATTAEQTSRNTESAASGVEEITSTIHEMISNIQNVAKGIQGQSVAVTQTSSSIEELTASIQQVANNAKRLAELSQKAYEAVNSGRRAVDKEIAELVHGIQKDTQSAVSNVESNVGVVEQALKISNEVVEALKSIEAAVTEVSKYSSEISAATSEQATNCEQISKAVTKLNEVTQEVSASADEQASGADQMVKAAEKLRDMIQENASSVTQLAASAEEISRQSDSLTEVAGRFTMKEEVTARKEEPPRPQAKIKAKTIKPESRKIGIGMLETAQFQKLSN